MQKLHILQIMQSIDFYKMKEDMHSKVIQKYIIDYNQDVY